MTTPHRLPHLAHRPRSVAGPGRKSATAAAEAPEVRDLLETLDDSMFAAIGGCQESLDQARQLWPVAIESLDGELVEESREQYLRYAVEITRRFEFKEIRNPAIAVAALEIIEMLTRGSRR